MTSLNFTFALHLLSCITTSEKRVRRGDYLRVRPSEMESKCIKETDESTLGDDSSPLWYTMIRVILDHFSWSGSFQRNALLLNYIPREKNAKGRLKSNRRKATTELESVSYCSEKPKLMAKTIWGGGYCWMPYDPLVILEILILNNYFGWKLFETAPF